MIRAVVVFIKMFSFEAQQKETKFITQGYFIAKGVGHGPKTKCAFYQ